MTGTLGGVTDAPTCAVCRAFVQKNWDWCEACGFDPNHLKPETWMPNGEAHDFVPVTPDARASVWAPVATFRLEEPTKVPMPGYGPRRSAAGWLGIGVALVLAVLLVGLATTRLLGQDVSAIAAGRVGTTVSTLPRWVTTASPDADFSVAFPGPPDLADGRTRAGLPEKTMTWTTGNDVYRVSWHDAQLKSATAAQQRTQLEALAGDLRASGTTATIVDRPGRPAVRFEGRNVAGQPLQGLMVVGWKHVIALVVSGPDAVAQSDRFFGGLQG